MTRMRWGVISGLQVSGFSVLFDIMSENPRTFTHNIPIGFALGFILGLCTFSLFYTTKKRN